VARIHYDGGGRYRTSGHLFEEGDIAEVDEELADYLCEKGAFGRVDETPTGAEDDAEEDVTDDEEPGESEDFDADEWIDEHHYQAREEQVRAGDVDEHLDAIAEAESSTTVQDAIGERRAEIEA